ALPVTCRWSVAGCGPRRPGRRPSDQATWWKVPPLEIVSFWVGDVWTTRPTGINEFWTQIWTGAYTVQPARELHTGVLKNLWSVSVQDFSNESGLRQFAGKTTNRHGIFGRDNTAHPWGRRLLGVSMRGARLYRTRPLRPAGSRGRI